MWLHTVLPTSTLGTYKGCKTTARGIRGIHALRRHTLRQTKKRVSIYSFIHIYTWATQVTWRPPPSHQPNSRSLGTSLGKQAACSRPQGGVRPLRGHILYMSLNYIYLFIVYLQVYLQLRISRQIYRCVCSIEVRDCHTHARESIFDEHSIRRIIRSVWNQNVWSKTNRFSSFQWHIWAQREILSILRGNSGVRN